MGRLVTATHLRDDQRLAVDLDGERWIVLDAVAAARLGLDVGVELDDDAVAVAEETAADERALARGARLVGRRSHARAELERRLARREGEAAARSAADRLAELGAVDDERHAAEVAQTRLRSGWGPGRIEHDLLAAGVAEQTVREAIDALAEDDVDAAARLALDGRQGAAGWQRLAARGFDEDAAERLLGPPDAA